MPESLELPEVQDKKSESLKLVLSVLPAFLIGMAFGLGKIVRDCSLTCNVGYELSPLAIIAAGIIAIPISAMTVRLAIRLGYPRWQVWNLAAIAISFFVFWFAVFVELKQTGESVLQTDNPRPESARDAGTDTLYHYIVGIDAYA